MRNLSKANIAGKRVLLRVDYNVPLAGKRVKDNTRIKASLPTIKYLLSKKAKQIIIITHLGRPKGKFVPELKLDPVAKELKKLLKKDVKKAESWKDLEKSKIVMLENIRFVPEEKNNDPKLAKKLSKLGDIYVNDAFSVSHRKHMSVHAITKYLPSYAGLLLEKEVKSITKALKKPKKPFVAVIGGKKISTKIEVIENLLKKADTVLLGGAMIFTFYKALGLEVGKSLIEKDKIKTAKNLLIKGKNKLILPLDVTVASEISAKAKAKNVSINNIPKNLLGLDVGKDSTTAFCEMLKKAGTIIWNGPLGVAEIKKFAKASEAVAKTIANNKGLTICGGGETLEIINKLKLSKKYSHISTAGGAFLELVSGKKLPGVEALK